MPIHSIPLFPNFAIIPKTCFNCFKKDLRVNTLTVKHDDRIRFSYMIKTSSSKKIVMNSLKLIIKCHLFLLIYKKIFFSLIFILLETVLRKELEKKITDRFIRNQCTNTTSRQISNDSRNTLLKNYCLSDHAER